MNWAVNIPSIPRANLRAAIEAELDRQLAETTLYEKWDAQAVKQQKRLIDHVVAEAKLIRGKRLNVIVMGQRANLPSLRDRIHISIESAEDVET